MENQLVRFLPWDTNHFGHRIGRANIRRLDEASWQLLRDACKQMEIDCLYFLADAGDLSSINELQRHGFIFVDVRVTIERTVPDAETPPSRRSIGDAILRPSRVDDVETLAAIARDSFTVTRFFADPFLDNEKVSAMYQIWITKSVTTDFADRVIVAEVNRESVGFVTCHLDRHLHEGKIALAALAASARGKGYSGAMIQHALEWFRDQGMERVNVPTQGSNISAQRMYQRRGFVTRSTELWFHKWFRTMP
ncbi:MAG: GNAT family N-acetyltransferase [Chloroflexi bacterium]|nr:GNAT family N-acetyltransferase [Chloroflexota bacterium]